MKIFTALAGLSILVLGACATTQNTTELNEQVDYYRSQALEADSLRTDYQSLQEEKGETEMELRYALNDLERLRATNISLNRSYQEILSQFNEQINTHQKVVATSSLQNQTLEQQLAEKQQMLDERERKLAQAEFELRNRQYTSNLPENSNSDSTTPMWEKEQKLMKLETLFETNRQKMALLRENIEGLFIRYTSNEVSLNTAPEKLVLLMSQNLMFGSDDGIISRNGREFLMQLAKILIAHPDFEIRVEGHVAAEGTAARSWDLSVQRATSIVKVLTAYGVPPERIIAAGRGFHDPLTQNNTPQGNLLNRRSEIILSANLDNLFKLLEN